MSPCLKHPVPQGTSHNNIPPQLPIKRPLPRRRVYVLRSMSLPVPNSRIATTLRRRFLSPLGFSSPSPSPPQMRASAKTFVSCLAISRLDLSVVYVSSPADVSKSIRKSFCPCEGAGVF